MTRSGPPRSIHGVHPRTATRLVAVAAVVVPFVALFHDALLAYSTLLTASSTPSSRELTLALLAVFSIVPPVVIATRIADLVHDRCLDG